MTLQQLEYVMAVYRFKHFAKAADYCNVTQPTLSSMIQRLEEELGMKLFDRKRQPIQPTKAGMKVIEQAWNILRRAKRLKETVEEEKHSLTGTITIGILPTIAPYLIPRFLPQLMNDWRDVDIQIMELKTEDMKRAIRHGDIDAGILARIDGLEEMSCQTLFYEQYYGYVSQNCPLYQKEHIKSTDLNGQQLWLLDEGHCFRDQLVKFCELKAAARSKRTYHLGSIETFMRIVEHGSGITFIPQLAIPQLSNEQKTLIRPFAIPIPTREIVLMTSPHFIRITLLQQLLDRIRASVPSEMLKLQHIQQSI